MEPYPNPISYKGNFTIEQVDRTMDLLYSKYSRALISYEGVYRVETFPVPREAMREAVINAVIHRDYADPVPIQIRVYDNRIMLWNPGHLQAKLEAKLNWQPEMGQSCKRALRVKPRAISYWQPQGMRIEQATSGSGLHGSCMRNCWK